MHGRDATTASILPAAPESEAKPARGRRDGRSPHIFHTPGPDEVFRAGGLIDPSKPIDDSARAQIYALATRLEARMWRSAGELWASPLSNATSEPAARSSVDNPTLPAGYTYLLQLIGHDVVDSVRSVAITENGAATVFRNARQRPLMLDTIYGDGPDECPHAYDPTGSDPVLPRTLLRLGALRSDGPPQAASGLCPFKDIARAASDPAADRPLLDETLIADPRNDAHAMLSQLTVLFHVLHNTVAGMVGEAMGTPPLGHRGETAERSYRRFLAARIVTTLIYRNVVEKDVLPRILDPLVHAAYAENPGLRLDDAEGLPLEVSAGAFRFGHAMVQEHYRANRDIGAAGLRFTGARDQSARRNPANVPVRRDWAVDWSLFFGADPEVNLSRRIGPFVTGSLMQEGPRMAVPTTPDGPGFAARGLPSRDLLTACHAGLWSVPALIHKIRKKLRKRGLDADSLLPDYAVWKKPIASWLKDYEGKPGPHQLSTDDIKRIAEDPPLSFFILFEAAHELDEKRRPRTADGRLIPGQGGRRLGPLGSFLLADTLWDALRSQPFGFDETGLSLAQRIAKVCEALVGPPSDKGCQALAGRFNRPLDEMTDVLAFLREQGAFTA